MNDEIKEKIKAYYIGNDIDKVVDYITNLQEENKELNDDNIWWSNRFKAAERDNREYKTRIDKAIEFIDNLPNGAKVNFMLYGGYEVKDILQGSDKE